MADNTVTSTLVTNLKFQRNPGLNIVYCMYDFKATGITTSTSLVVQMVPVPDGARILDILVRNDGFVTGGFVVGDSSLSNRFITGASLSAAGQLTRLNVPGGAGYIVSLTASAQNSYDTIDWTMNGATSDSASGCIHMTVWYVVER